MNSSSLIGNFYKYEQSKPNAPFLNQPFGDKWETYTWAEVGQKARRLVAYFDSLDLKPKSHISIISKNCREWIIADIAIMMAGHISVPFFPTLTSKQIAEVVELGDVDLLIIGKLEVWEEMKEGIPKDLPKIKFPQYNGANKIDVGKDWDEIMSEFEPMSVDHMPTEEDLWTIIFTSGTTGTPKGVMLDQKSLKYFMNLFATDDNPLKVSYNKPNRFFSFLPLNHIAERVLVELMCINFGGQIFFAESLASFPANLQDAKPTYIFAVPRIWNKFMTGVLAKLPQKKLSLLLKIPFINTIIKNKIAKGLGLQNSRCNSVGAAAIPQSTKDWFASIGIPLTEGYGMTENCASCTYLPDNDRVMGSVGRAQVGVELKIDEETDEVLMRGEFVMKGYYKDPEKSAEALKDGWLHTGDSGRIDENGYLFLTGRVKDTFKTAKGKFIVPQKIEDHFGDNVDIEQMCVLGLGAPQPILMVHPSELGWAKSKDDLKESIQKTLSEANELLPNYQKISTIVITKKAFCVEDNTMTPTLKIKRNIVHQIYADKVIDFCKLEETVIFE